MPKRKHKIKKIKHHQHVAYKFQEM